MFYTFSQNNSGGSFEVDDLYGIGHTVIVEADSADEANTLAEQIGLYFDGNGDCECCGYRWSDFWSDEEGDEVPSYYGKPILEYVCKWNFMFEDVLFVHYKSGQVDKYTTDKNKFALVKSK